VSIQEDVKALPALCRGTYFWAEEVDERNSVRGGLVPARAERILGSVAEVRAQEGARTRAGRVHVSRPFAAFTTTPARPVWGPTSSGTSPSLTPCP